jgi:hypothetical protein
MSAKINPKLKNILNVGGNGLWSNTLKKVNISKMEVHYYYESEDDVPKWGELRVFFHKKSWDINKYGIIYTDKTFLKELSEWLVKLKINSKADYSEQGMQGDYYVSLDVDKKFIIEWDKRKFKIVKTLYRD